VPTILERLANLFRRPQKDIPRVSPRALLPEPEQDLADWPLFDWPQERIREMLQEFMSGEFELAEDFYENLRRDGRIYDGFRKRGDAIRRFPEEWWTEENAPKEVKGAVERLQKSWGIHCLTKSDKSETIRRLAAFGFCFLHKRYAFLGGVMAPVLTPWTHRGISWDSNKRCFRLRDKHGKEFLVPLTGSDEFLVVSSGGEMPWMNGAILPLAKLFLLLNQGWDKWAQYNDVQALAIRVLKTPFISRESLESGEAYEYVRRLRAGDTWLNPRERGGQEGYELELLESKHSDAYKTFLDLLKECWSIVAIILLGHNLSQEVKAGSLAATKEAVDVTRDVSVADAEALDAGLRPLFPEWLLANFSPSYLEKLDGPAEYYAPRYGHCTDEPEDEAALSETHSRNATALKTTVESLKAAGVDIQSVPIDWCEAVKRCGVPLLPMGRQAPVVKYLPEPEPAEEDPPQALLSGRSTRRRVLLLGGRESETEGDRRALLAAQRYVDGLTAWDFELHAAQRAALAGADDYEQLRAALIEPYRAANATGFAQRLAEQMALAELAGYLSIIEGYPLEVRLFLNADSRWRVPALFEKAVSWFSRRLERAAAVPVEYEIGKRVEKRAPEVARATQLDTTNQLVRHAESGEKQGKPLPAMKAELRAALEELGLTPGGAPTTEALPVREQLQESFVHTRTEVLSVDFYRAAFPHWRYTSVIDTRTTAGCRALDGLVMPAKDPRWVGFTPPRHWKCRAHIEAVGDSVAAQAEKKSPPAEFVGEGSFGTLRDAWEPRPGNYPDDLWGIYKESAGIGEPHIIIPGPWWRKEKRDAVAR
jgi:SPP1 gp7 family putative phage head morphogenesis protein